MASKTYRCIVEVTTRPQTNGKRLTFYPEDVIESKFLRGQTDRLIEMGTIELIKKVKAQPVEVIVESENGT